jgi:hypothetical protein
MGGERPSDLDVILAESVRAHGPEHHRSQHSVVGSQRQRQDDAERVVRRIAAGGEADPAGADDAATQPLGHRNPLGLDLGDTASGLDQGTQIVGRAIATR